jgi:NAD(P)-dependent dehydrogenase (short-subunit alcohol dehydrogenase family)
MNIIFRTTESTMHPTKRSYYYAISGANAGLGLESVHQLASLYDDETASTCNPIDKGESSDSATAAINTTIFMLCRNSASAQNEIESLQSAYPNVTFIYIPFDASNRSSVEAAIDSLKSEMMTADDDDGNQRIINGLLLNAGGFTSDRTGTLTSSGTTVIAETNLIGHAILLDGLIQSKAIGNGSRVIFSGSEAGMGEPFAIKWENNLDYYVNILNGNAYKKGKRNNYKPQDAYGHVKGMIAFYGYAMAKRHKDIYFATVSPGSTKDTHLMEQGSFPNALKRLFKGFICLMGQHGVDIGASRYIDAMVVHNNNEVGEGQEVGWYYESGTFVCSKKGYIGEVCDATELKKGKPFGEEVKQDLVYKAVQMCM